MDLTFSPNDPQHIGAASYLENGPGPRSVNHYLRFLLTYSDRTGKLHHTDRCYQVVKGVTGGTNVFGCLYGDRSD